MTLTNEQKLGILRHILTCAGGIIVTLGKLNDAQVQQILGLILTIAPMVWSVASKTKDQGATPPAPGAALGSKSGLAAIALIAIAAIISASVAAVTARMHNRSNDMFVYVVASSNVVVTASQTAQPTGGGSLTVPVQATPAGAGTITLPVQLNPGSVK